jgi:hypothetical protein
MIPSINCTETKYPELFRFATAVAVKQYPRIAKGSRIVAVLGNCSVEFMASSEL